ncbi:hypothetical protein EAE96_010604 [Botrytis aclada]|nr:hypothetical protein EAE96_010604 [Botrytis aclada]
MSPDNIQFKVELAGRWLCLLHTRTTYPKTAPGLWGITFIIGEIGRSGNVDCIGLGYLQSSFLFTLLFSSATLFENLGEDILPTIMQFTAYTICKLDRYFRHSIDSPFLGVVLDFGDQIQSRRPPNLFSSII